MERTTWHKNSRSSEGYKQNQRQYSSSRLSSYSRYYTDGSNIDDAFIFEFEKRSSTGLPMQKLLLEETSKEIEANKRKPGVIARLMGLEGLPSPRHAHRQQKRSLDSSLQKNNSVASKLGSQLLAGQFNLGRSSIEKQQAFKDVYEDLEASHLTSHRCSSKPRTKSVHTEPDMFLIQQKCFDADKFSNDVKLQDFEKLDSDKDFLPKFPKQLDTMDLKHSNGSSTAVLSPLRSEKFDNYLRPWSTERHTSHKPHSTQLNRKDDLLLEQNSRHKGSPSQSLPSFYPEKDNEENVLPTRIVVLKPNLGNLGGTPYHCNHRDGSGGKESWCRKCAPHAIGFPKSMSKKAREIARLVTVRMREGLDEAADLKSAAYRGYIGDESSYESNDSDSESSDSELYKLPPYRKSFTERDFYGYSSSSFGESSVNKEAKRRLSDRWKIAHGYQNFDIKEGNNTLAAMLALTDRDSRPTKSTASRLGSYSGPATKLRPLSSNGIGHGKCICHGDAEWCSRNKVSVNDKKRHSRHDEIDSLMKTDSGMRLEFPSDYSEQRSSIYSSPAADDPMKLPNPKHGNLILSPTSPDITLPSKQESSPDSHRNALPCGKNSVLLDEADHPSPVSVLEVPCQEVASFESFEKVSADLHELRKHLQLLKQESSEASSSSTLLPIEEDDTTATTPSFSEQDNNSGSFDSKCWQTSYATDVLLMSSSGPEEEESWHLADNDNPLDPKLFDELEKKYGASETRSERKLLFDRLNSALLDIFREHVDCFPWVRPNRLVSKGEGVWDAVEGLMRRDFSSWEMMEWERDVDKEMHWWGGKGEIDDIGTTIEKVLIDEIVCEVVTH